MNHPKGSTLARLRDRLRDRWRSARDDERGATAIEWAIFALLSIAVAGLVAAAITFAVTNRLPGITGAPRR